MLGNATASSAESQQAVTGLDATYNLELNTNQSLMLQTEYFQALYGEDGEERASQSGGYVSAFYKFNEHYQAGVRYGTLGKHGQEADSTTKSQLAYILTRQLTETSKFRIQYNTGENVTDTMYAQFIFGMGPHSHVLQ